MELVPTLMMTKRERHAIDPCENDARFRFGRLLRGRQSRRSGRAVAEPGDPP